MGSGAGVAMITGEGDGVPGRAGARTTDGSTSPSKNGNSPELPHATASPTTATTAHGVIRLRPPRRNARLNLLATMLKIDTAISNRMHPRAPVARNLPANQPPISQ